jgi:hypothetical protein
MGVVAADGRTLWLSGKYLRILQADSSWPSAQVALMADGDSGGL